MKENDEESVSRVVGDVVRIVVTDFEDLFLHQAPIGSKCRLLQDSTR